MGTRGFFAYRYNKKYYRQFLSHSAYPSDYGQQFASMVPRDPSAFKDWVHARIKMLESAKTGEEEVIISNEDPDTLGYELCADPDWTFPGGDIEWTYVIDLDNLIFTVNGMTHLKLDNMPPSEPGLEDYFENEVPIPRQYIGTALGLWPAPGFDVQERQQAYKALNPIITSVTEWGTLTWDKMSFPQRFSIELTHFLIQKTSHKVALAYAPEVREKTGRFCWDILCTVTPATPLLYDSKHGPQNMLTHTRGDRPYGMCYNTGVEDIKSLRYRGSNEYCWIRGCLVTFCVRLGDPAYVAHEVEQMVGKIQHDGHAECIGIILSSQQEMIAVAVDDGLKPTRKVRHTPVLDIRPNPDKSGEASDGLLLLVQLLSPPLTSSQPLWRAPQSPQSPVVWSWSRLPLETVQHIVHYADTKTYLSLCLVSKSVRSVCLAYPRVGEYTILYRIPEYKLAFAARHPDDEVPTVITLGITQGQSHSLSMLQIYDDRQHHQVFKVPELLSLICSFLRTPDCVNLAQTCKPIFKIAMAFVWQHVDGAQNLLTLLSGTLIIADNKDPESRKIAIGVAASAVDFSRFDSYAPYVRRLTVYGHEAKYFRVSGWSPLLIRANSRPLLPNLLSMVMQTKCDRHGPDLFMWIKAFSGPSILTIQATPSHLLSRSPPRVSPLAASAILETIAARCPRLLRLSLFVSESLGLDKYDGENNMLGVIWQREYHHYFRALPTLYELSCSVTMLQSDCLKVIGSLPGLTRLSVYSSGGLVVLQPPHLSSNSFPSLNELSLQDINPYEAASIMQIAPLMKRLTLLELITNPEYLDFDDLRDEWITGTLLLLLSNSPRLTALHVDLDPVRENEETYDIGHQDVMDTFSKLPLISLTLTGVHIGDWASTGSLKTVWPLLSSLRMRNQYASPLILSCFAQLPRLQHLTLSVCLENMIIRPNILLLCPLQTLEISDGIVTMMEPEDLEHTSR
ncbi:F-box protein [Rhizoctonia solani 123E]|uniref:F-box protein n=1 Tax=Rhizoctonia solani 123E TaxID=1423351 RepID=A0A074SR44_9AGAM|nr:F-box protein [Rhizoctonia solani 123E]